MYLFDTIYSWIKYDDDNKKCLYFQEEIAKLLRFESSNHPAGITVSLPEYCNRLQAGQRDIFYLSAPR